MLVNDSPEARAWLALLDDPNTPQATGRLKTRGGGYCCLGVLCTITNPLDWIKDDEGEPLIQVKPSIMGEETLFPTMPPHASLERVGMSYDDASTLAALNDHGAPFRVIADVIRNAHPGSAHRYIADNYPAFV